MAEDLRKIELMVAGLAMAMGSVTVVSLSLLLKGYMPPAKAERG